MHLNCVNRYRGDETGSLDYLRSSGIVTYPRIRPNRTSNEKGIIDPYTRLVHGYGTGGLNQTTSFFVIAAWNASESAQDIDNYIDPLGYDKQQPIEYLYGAIFNEQKTWEIQACRPNVVTVDAEVDCQNGDCTINRVRKAPNFDQGNCVMYDQFNAGCLTKGNQGVADLIDFFPTATTQPYTSAQTNPYDHFIIGNDVSYRSISDEYPRERSNISDRTISERLTILLNSYWHVATWGSQITTGGVHSHPDLPREGSTIDPRRHVNTTNAVTSLEVSVYSANVGWIVTLLLISVVLLPLSIVNAVVTFTTLAPDLFYYASSLAHENPYTDTPDRGTAMDGGERSRLLKAMKVQITDVSPEKQIGHVVLKSIGDDDSFKTGRLKNGRLYW
jgi:hypothetical protein